MFGKLKEKLSGWFRKKKEKVEEAPKKEKKKPKKEEKKAEKKEAEKLVEEVKKEEVEEKEAKEKKPVVETIVILIGVILVASGISYFYLGDDVNLSPKKLSMNKELTKQKFSGVEKLPAIEPFNKKAKQDRIELILSKGKAETITGSLKVIHHDDFETISETEYFIRDGGGKRTKIYLPNNLGLISGAKVGVEGIEFGGEMVVSDFDVIEEMMLTEEDNPNLGEQRTLVILVNFLDNQAEPFTAQNMNQTIFNQSNFDSLNPFYQEVSYGKAWFEGTTYGWYTVNMNSDECSFYDLAEQAIAAVDPEIDFSNAGYNRLIYFHPAPHGCGSVASGSLGLVSIETDEGTMNMSIARIAVNSFIDISDIYSDVTRHELGHNFGGWHANDWECNLFTLGDNCFSMEYGDAFDVLGGQNQINAKGGHFNSIHKEAVGWFDPSNVIETNSPGVYIIEPLETSGAGAKTLKIPTVNGFSYYVEYRRPIGYDTHFPGLFGEEIFDGIMIRFGGGWWGGHTTFRFFST